MIAVHSLLRLRKHSLLAVILLPHEHRLRIVGKGGLGLLCGPVGAQLTHRALVDLGMLVGRLVPSMPLK
jgi:hypothetical protein